MKDKVIRVYIAGPYTKGDMLENVRKAILMGTELFKMGFAPYVPHLTHFWGFLTPMAYEDWLRLDNYWLEVSDVVLRLPGESNGADKEVELANELMIPVFYSVDDLKSATNKYSYINH